MDDYYAYALKKVNNVSFTSCFVTKKWSEKRGLQVYLAVLKLRLNIFSFVITSLITTWTFGAEDWVLGLGFFDEENWSSWKWWQHNATSFSNVNF